MSKKKTLKATLIIRKKTAAKNSFMNFEKHHKTKQLINVCNKYNLIFKKFWIIVFGFFPLEEIKIKKH